MDGASLEREIKVAVRLVLRAAHATEQIRRQGIQGIQKEDHTPITQGDVVSQVILLRGLQENFPEDRVIAEEFVTPGERSDLRAAAYAVLRERHLLDRGRDLERWVNYRGNPSGVRMWMVDPIDGTKGFEKGLCYAVVMGLYAAGKPLFGCMAAPSLPVDGGENAQLVVAYGGANRGAFWSMDEGQSWQEAHVSRQGTLSRLRLVGSRAHDGGDVCGRFMARTGAKQLIRLDGQAKYLLLAMGRADLYLRSSDPFYGIAFPWDHCAGQAILEGAGGEVSDFDGNPINYDQPAGSPIVDSNGLAASNGQCHGSILNVVRSIVT